MRIRKRFCQLHMGWIWSVFSLIYKSHQLPNDVIEITRQGASRLISSLMKQDQSSDDMLRGHFTRWWAYARDETPLRIYHARSILCDCTRFRLNQLALASHQCRFTISNEVPDFVYSHQVWCP